MVTFILLIVGYILISIGACRVYFYLQCQNNQRRAGSFMKLISSYLLFAGFICLIIPFTIFFPSWLSEKLEFIDRTQNSTMYFILFGCVILIIALWKGRIHDQKQF